MSLSLDHFQHVYRILDRIYPEEITFLTYLSPFQLLISVILSARTTDRQVNAVTGELFKRFPDAPSLAGADRTEVENLIRPVGFFHQKSIHIIETAEALIGRSIPDTIQKLLQLPGVGRKSANVIMGAVFGKPAIIVDTHFSRVVYRLGWTKSLSPTTIEKELKKLLPPEKQYRTSMMLNLLGRETCRSKNPSCSECPITACCPRLIRPSG